MPPIKCNKIFLVKNLLQEEKIMILSLMELCAIGGCSFVAGYVVDNVVSKIQARTCSHKQDKELK